MIDFSNPLEVGASNAPKSPIKKYIEWRGSTGTWGYTEKIEDDQGRASRRKVDLGESIWFCPLVIFNCVTGYNKTLGCGIRSNEVLNLTKELVVFAGLEEVARGLYKDIKQRIKALDGKFTIRAYGLLLKKETPAEVVVTDFSGSALSAWIEKKTRPATGELLFLSKAHELMQNGSVSYYTPTITSKGAFEQVQPLIRQLWPPVAEYLNKREDYIQGLEAIQEAVQEEIQPVPQQAPVSPAPTYSKPEFQTAHQMQAPIPSPLSSNIPNIEGMSFEEDDLPF